MDSRPIARISKAQVSQSEDGPVLSIIFQRMQVAMHFRLTEEILEAIQADIQRVLQDQDRSCYRPVCEVCGTRLVWEDSPAPALSAPGFWIHPIPDLNAHTPRPVWTIDAVEPGSDYEFPICRSCRKDLAWSIIRTTILDRTSHQGQGIWVHADRSDTHAPMPVWGVSRSLL